jgi:hypothetical protein
MQTPVTKWKTQLAEIPTLLRGEPETIFAWSEGRNAQRHAWHLGVIIVGAGCYGAAMGWWRDPRQAFYVAIKFPLIILLTTFGNALLNSMLAPLLGLNITFRQSFSAMVMSFTIAAMILGAFSPLILFLVWNAPDLTIQNLSSPAYNFILLAHVAVIALAGVTGNARLFQWLTRLGGSRAIALRVQLAWLAGNLFLGSQLSWILRPFIGSPALPVELFRKAAFDGNFFEAVLHSLGQIFPFK